MTVPAKPRSEPPARLPRRLGTLAVALAGVLGLGCLLLAMSFPLVFRVGRVEGQAMSPTLRDQDRLLISKLSYYSNQPQRGDIVMMHYPRDPKRLFVKRVIAGPGDTVHIRSGQTFVNGQPEAAPYVVPEARSADTWGPAVVPEGSYFVMGDRRNNSSDSRHWGYVPAGYVVGRVTLRWWPMADARRF
jgi:signal peptidase I